MSRKKDKGTAFETLIARYLQQELHPGIERRALSGTQDKGDLAGVFDSQGRPVVVECKNHARPALPEWLREAEQERLNANAHSGVVVHKRRGNAKPADQYVTMTLSEFVKLLKGRSE